MFIVVFSAVMPAQCLPCWNDCWCCVAVVWSSDFAAITVRRAELDTWKMPTTWASWQGIADSIRSSPFLRSQFLVLKLQFDLRFHYPSKGFFEWNIYAIVLCDAGSGHVLRNLLIETGHNSGHNVIPFRSLWLLSTILWKFYHKSKVLNFHFIILLL